MILSRPSLNPFPQPLNVSSPGTRTRVLLGDTGSEYVMVACPDDGLSQWQAIVSAGTSVEGLVRQIRNCELKDRYLTAIDYHPSTRAWYVAGQKRDGTGWYCWNSSNLGSDACDLVRRRGQPHTRVSLGSTRDEDGSLIDACVVVDVDGNNHGSVNVPEGLWMRMQWSTVRNLPIHRVKLFERGGYFIRNGEGGYWDGLQSGVTNELSKPGRVLDVAIAKNGSWVVIRDNGFSCSPGIASDLKNYLNLFYERQKSRIERREQEIVEHNAMLAAEALEQERLRQEAANEAREQDRVRLEVETSVPLQTLRPLCDDLRLAQAELERHRERVVAMQESISNQLGALPPDALVMVEERLGWHELAEATSSSSSSPSGTDAGVVAACVICTDEPAIRALVPCGHLCLCDECSTRLLNPSSSATNAVPRALCPLCRRGATSSLRIYRQDS